MTPRRPRARLSPEPFAAWLRTMGSDSGAIARRVGLGPRTVHRIVNGRTSFVTGDVVDQAFVNLGVQCLWDELYNHDGANEERRQV
jgi:hypothetical protein